MSLFSSKKDVGEAVLLLDIGNGSIGGAFAFMRANNSPEIIYNTRLPFIISDTVDASKLFENMVALLEEILTTLVEKGMTDEHWRGKNKNIEAVLATFSSPWFTSKTKHLNIAQEKPFVITKAFLDQIIAQEQELFKKELGESGSGESGGFDLIESSIVHAKINGYVLDTVIGKETKMLDTFLSLSVVPIQVSTVVYESISKHIKVNKKHISLRTFPLVSFSLVRDLYHNISDFIIMDITGEVTDITVVSGGVMSQTASFPSGRNFLIRHVASAFGVPPDIALSLIRTYSWNKTDEATTTAMQEVLTTIEKEWSRYFDDAFASLSQQIMLPGRMYITADGDTAPFFANFIKLSETSAMDTFRRNVDLTHLNHTVLETMYQANQKMVVDEFVGMLAIFYDKMSKSKLG